MYILYAVTAFEIHPLAASEKPTPPFMHTYAALKALPLAEVCNAFNQ
jgi:hypothetical protein